MINDLCCMFVYDIVITQHTVQFSGDEEDEMKEKRNEKHVK